MSEISIMNAILAATSKLKVRLFRNNVGKAWIGKSLRVTKYDTVNVAPGDVIIRNARRFHAGLCEGSSDLIGWTQKEITQDMVGETLAVFTSVECKTAKGKVSKSQKNFLDVVEKVGGYSCVGRSAEEVCDHLSSKTQNNQSKP